jgi:hypothetical protein
VEIVKNYLISLGFGLCHHLKEAEPAASRTMVCQMRKLIALSGCLNSNFL